LVLKIWWADIDGPPKFLVNIDSVIVGICMIFWINRKESQKKSCDQKHYANYQDSIAQNLSRQGSHFTLPYVTIPSGKCSRIDLKAFQLNPPTHLRPPKLKRQPSQLGEI
jgi:hypothetical protein